MNEPRPIGDTIARLDSILTARGLTPTDEDDTTSYSPDEPGHPDYHHLQRVSSAVGRWSAATPPRYKTAEATDPRVTAWGADVIADPGSARSLLITGPTGTGKTHQAYGALRLVAESGPSNFHMIATTSADLYGDLRPTGTTGSAEHQLRRVCEIPLLLFDDLGSAKTSEWTEEITYRLINYRYNQCLPSVFTSNLPAHAPRDGQGRTTGPDLTAALGERIVSRLAEMTTLVPMAGRDLRRPETVTGEGGPR